LTLIVGTNPIGDFTLFSARTGSIIERTLVEVCKVPAMTGRRIAGRGGAKMRGLSARERGAHREEPTSTEDIPPLSS
jgi:hypothetical protein